MNSFVDGFKAEIKKRTLEDKGREIRQDEHEKKILSTLPVLYNEAINYFLPFLEETSIQIEKEHMKINLHWANDEKYIGQVSFMKYRFYFQRRFLELSLNKHIGYIGATAKIDIITNQIPTKISFLKNGIFIDIGIEEEENVIKYMIQTPKLKAIKFDEKAAKELLSSVFL